MGDRAPEDNGTLRTYPTGATRDTAEGKPEPWGFTSALTEKAFCEYMNKHRVQSDGQLRASDNWKQGINTADYFHSLSRHVLDLRLIWEGFGDEARSDNLIEVLCAIKFNVDGLLHELAKKRVSPTRAAGY
jgi:hypothetical protein